MDFLTSLSEGGQFAIQIIIVLICLFYGAKNVRGILKRTCNYP